ncbi:MAG: D-alanine--(R)-lactate ligase [Firmicutes bacterium HGW-Firmicutes-16]|nr:MAG: D-alanine--(R)-lactate ligase [Firmicutes bacterium HGW-Firmicutes-16]
MLNIAIIFGGLSSEHEVSLQSAYSIIKNLDRKRFNPIMVGITPAGEWFRFKGDIGKIADGTWCNPSDCSRALISPDREMHGLLEIEKDAIYGVLLDAAMPVMHGKNGEDGTVQGLLELAGIPIVGCGVLSSALCMDKHRAHQLAHIAGVPVPRSFVLTDGTDLELAREYMEMLKYPIYIKPVKAGSSFGITRVAEEKDLAAAIVRAFEYDNEVIMEENIEGFEVGCAVMGNDELVTGEVDEIELSDGFFDFTEKYNLITSKIHVPARISKQKAKEIKTTAKVIYKALGCRGFARVDMFLKPSGEIVFNEVNTIPGFTSHSRYPNMMKAVGLSFTEVITAIIDLAVDNENA